MSPYPGLSSASTSLPTSLFARLYDKLAAFRGPVIPLQVGDTWLPPPAQGGLCATTWGDVPTHELYAYAPPGGWGPFVTAVAHKLGRANGFEVGPANIQVTAGATHALACAVGALLDPGDELLVMTPHWPLIRGIAQARSVRPIEVAGPGAVGDDAAGVCLAARLAAVATARTTAVYLSNPNNPDGHVWTEAELQAVVEVARARGWWILADEVYEDYVWHGAHVSIARLPGAFERCVSVYSMSKSFAQAGLRVGYAVGPAPAITALRSMANHSIYNVPQAMQRAALGAMTEGDTFLAKARASYLDARDFALARLAVPARAPAAATYLFLDLRAYSQDDCMPVLERIAEAGVLLAPGAGFGAAFAGWARLCFTAVDRERLAVGLDRINEVLARDP